MSVLRRVCYVVGARPNFVKVAPLIRATRRCTSLEPILIHTGQHDDDAMAGTFFRDLGIPNPDHHLGAGGGTVVERLTAIIGRCADVLGRAQPAMVVVVGDVDSTLAAALATVKGSSIPLAHVEAGLRSFNRRMPEEVNRVIVDHCAEILFTSEPSGRVNLEREGIPPSRIYDVGNVMIDSLRAILAASADDGQRARIPRSYAVITIHRPENVDARGHLVALMRSLAVVAKQIPCVWPLHPRTALRLRDAGLLIGVRRTPGIAMVEPLRYPAMVSLLRDAAFVLTDSGGVQEEATALGVPCGTVRTETERPITVTIGTNTVIGTAHDAIVQFAMDAVHQVRNPAPALPPLWDGRAADRIVHVIARAVVPVTTFANAP